MMKYWLLLMLALPAFCRATEPTAGTIDKDARRIVWFQAHRGGLRELPENTMSAFERTWRLGGIQEVDIRSTRDDVIICLHDSTLKRTTNALDMINS